MVKLFEKELDLATIFARCLAPEQIITTSEGLVPYLKNSLGIERRVLGVLKPSECSQVQEIVQLAAQHRVAIYPVSCGKNRGYGDYLPPTDDQVILDLSGLNRIRSFDSVSGIIWVEPGVTQEQLYHYLVENNLPFIMDTTGAGLQASLVGNALEGGFGHSPMGNRRQAILDAEIVLADGQLLQTGLFPSLGPNLAGLFVQSNFAIVTALSFRLFPRPEKVESFVISIDLDAKLGKLVEKIAALRSEGTLSSLVHIANALRTVMTIEKFEESWNRPELLTNQEAIRMTSVLARIGAWNAMGTIYGSSAQVCADKEKIKRTFRGIGKVQFFNDRLIKVYQSLLSLAGFFRLGFSASLEKGLDSLRTMHNFVKGVPSDLAAGNQNWRIIDPERAGLIWLAPTIAPQAGQVEKIVNLFQQLFSQYGFEMPLTITLVEGFKAVCVFSIAFDKVSLKQKEVAYQLYQAMWKECEQHGWDLYRTGIASMEQVKYTKEKQLLLDRIKTALDPKGIIAPRRYGIGSEH